MPVNGLRLTSSLAPEPVAGVTAYRGRQAAWCLGDPASPASGSQAHLWTFCEWLPGFSPASVSSPVTRTKDAFQRHLRLFPLDLCVTLSPVDHDGDMLNQS